MHGKTTIVILPLLLLGCGPGTKLGTIAGGECQLVHTPKYEVLGKTRYDRIWIEDTEEALVRGCSQPRPLRRPASFDKPPSKPKPKAKVLAKPSPIPSPPPKPPVAETKPATPIYPPVLETTPTPPTPVIPVAPAPKKRWWQLR